ncbi:MAG: hypothetical protein PVI71_10185 [Desulfobacterales bacterium]
MFSRITNMLQNCDTDQGILPPTEVYNEGWMLRLILDWFSRQPASNHQLSFEKDARWYSETLLPSPFLPRFQQDPNSETYTHADGVIGHFTISRSGKCDIDLHPDAKQFVVIEAKIFSRLTKGIRNFKNYDQAARTTACIAETLSIGQRQIEDISRLGFFVVAPEKQLKFEPTFQTFLQKDSIRIKVQKRIKSYSDSTEAKIKDKWFKKWFLPTLECIDIQCMNWEEIIAYINAIDQHYGDALFKFYEKSLALNQPKSKLGPAEKLTTQVSTEKLAEYRVLTQLRSMGLVAYKPVPDRGIDIEVKSLEHPDKIISVQVKGRNPKYDPNWRWFKIRVQPKELSQAKKDGLDPDQTWIDKVNKVDFFVLDAVRHDEMWVLPKEKIFELIKLNEHRYGSRPDNIFNYEKPLKQKQKEMNLDIEVNGEKLTQKFAEYLDNFQLILDALIPT